MKLENKKGEYLMALVDLTSVTTGNIGTNTNFIVEENKVLKRISQSSLLKTSAISTTQVNSTTNVPSSSLVYSMNQAINTLNNNLDNNFARAALSHNLLAPCDRPTFLQWNPETLNTPYKAELTSSSYGFAFVYGSYTTQMVLFAMALGTYEIFVCAVNNGQTSTWKKITSDFSTKINPEPTTLR